jgi:hypothetical protein
MYLIDHVEQCRKSTAVNATKTGTPQAKLIPAAAGLVFIGHRTI